MMMIVRTAPINNSSPAVENSLTDVFDEDCSSERLTKNAVIIANIHRMTKTTIAATMKGSTSERLILLVIGVMP